MSDDRMNWYRRQAHGIASQLPDEPEAAWAILRFVVEMQAEGFGPPPPPPAASADNDQVVLRFTLNPSSPKRRASSSGSPSGLPK